MFFKKINDFFKEEVDIECSLLVLSNSISKVPKFNSDILGSWSCTQYSTQCIDANSSYSATQYWSDHSSGLYATKSVVITFSGTNSFKFSSRGIRCTPSNILNALNTLYPNWAIEGTYEIAGNIFFVLRTNKPEGSDFSGGIWNSVYLMSEVGNEKRTEIQKLSESQFLWTYDSNTHFLCNKQNLVPKPPSSLTYALPADNSSSSIT